MLRRLVILFVVLACAATTGVVAVGISNDVVSTPCDEGHTWEDWAVFSSATCTEEGLVVQRCVECATTQEVKIPALGHDMAVLPGSAKDPNCEEDGCNATMECVRKGCDYSVTGESIDALGHAYGEWISNGNGTHKKVCANDGSHVVTENCSGGTATCTEKAICSVCGVAYGPEPAHVYSEQNAIDANKATEATCTTQATYYYTCECGEKGTETFAYGELADHVYNEDVIDDAYLKTSANCQNDAVYYFSCECGAKGTETFIAEGTKGEHSFTNTTVKDATTLVSEATCTAHAVYKYTCTGCDAIGTETYEGEILDHEMTYHAAVEATCKVEGFVEYWACATCSKNYDAEQGGTEIENVSLGLNANNHKNVVVTKEAQDSTCTVAGWTKEETCNDCNVVVTVSEALALASHSEVTTTENEVEATCTTAGSYDTVVTCSVCTTELSRVNTVVDALGHECSTTEANTCVRCDKVFTASEVWNMANALGHNELLVGKFQFTGIISEITYTASTSISANMVVEDGQQYTFNCFKLTGKGFDVVAVGDTITVEGVVGKYNSNVQFNGTNTGDCVLKSSLHSVTLGEIDTTKGNATLSVNEQVAIGTTVEVEIDLVKGYAVESVLVNGKRVTTYEGNVFSFVVEKSSTVVVNFKEAGAESEAIEPTATLTFDSAKENRTEYSTEKQVWQQNGVILTNNKANSTSNVGDYAGRFYKNSDVIISFTKKMTKIVIDATGMESKYYTPYADSITNYTVTVESGIVTIDLGEGVESITFTTAAQLRAKSITVYYVDENAAPAHTHVPGTAVEENRVEATCEAAGSYDEVVYCTDITCMGEISRETKAIEKKAHTEEIIPGKAATCIATGLTEGKKCSVCGEILLEQEEIGLVAHTPSAPVEKNRVEATCEAAGSYDSVVYCSVDGCGYEISRTPNTIAKKEHTMTHYEAVTPTCQVAGNVEYWACSVCEKNYNAEQDGNEISDVNLGYGACVDVNPEDNKCDVCGKTMCEHEWSAWTSVDAENHSRECLKPTCGKVETVNHSGNEAVEENKKDSTCYAEGSFDLVVYCKDCNHKMSSTTETIAKKAHTPAEAVEENKTDSTCYAEGSYDLVVYCSVAECGAEISKETKTIAKKDHTPAEAVEENRVEATCEAAGSYDLVVRCSVEECKAIISSESKTIEKKDHSFPTTWTTADGKHTHKCDNCEETEEGDCADENADNKCDVCGADMPVEELAATPYNYSFTGKVFNGNGTQALGDVNWTLSGDATTFNYDGSNGRGQQFGTGSAPATVITLTSEKKFGNIGKIIVNAAGATNTNAVLTVKVGGNIVGTFNVTKAAADYEVTFEEAIKGVVEIELTQTSKVAMYIKTIFIDKPACKHIETQDVDEIPATCLETGLTAGKKCVACGEYTEGGEEIAKADHNYGADGKCTTEGCDAEQGVAAEPETVTMTTFTATSGDLGEGASFTTAKGGGTTAPAVNSGEIRLYQNSAGTGGGTITISAKEGYKIQSVTIGSSMKTSIAYTIDGGSTKSATESLVANGKYTYDASEVDTITFYCMGADKNSRLYVNYLSVTYVEA